MKHVIVLLVFSLIGCGSSRAAEGAYRAHYDVACSDGGGREEAKVLASELSKEPNTEVRQDGFVTEVVTPTTEVVIAPEFGRYSVDVGQVDNAQDHNNPLPATLEIQKAIELHVVASHCVISKSVTFHAPQTPPW